MPLESGSAIVDLNSSWPLGGDFLLDGDNHLRLIKDVLKTAFPGAGGLGFATPITATEAELNFVGGVTSSIQAQLDAITGVAGVFPSGTKMSFFQAAPPPGWTQVTTFASSMMRVVSGAGGGSGGSDDPISATLAHTHTTGAHALTASEMPQHNHLIVSSGSKTGSLTSSNNWAEQRDTGTTGQDYTLEGKSGTPDLGVSGNVGSGNTHTHGNTGSAALNYAPKYVDMIIATLD